MAGDDILRRKSKAVDVIDSRIIGLLDDMVETMRHHDGIGLAAVQVGSLRRIVVVDVSEDGDNLVELINPEIIASDGVQQGNEGCLSVPKYHGLVDRPATARVRAQNRHGEWFEMDCEGDLSIAVCHEIDHLDGVMYMDRALKMYQTKDDE